MKLLEKTIKREVYFSRVSRSLPGRRWAIEIGPSGLSVREKGSQDVRWIDWYRLVGFLRVHGSKKTTNGGTP